MLKSMTGFGRGCAQTKTIRVTVELSSVNRKQLDISMRLPAQLTAFESKIQKTVQHDLARGRVSGTVQIETVDGRTQVVLDEKKAEAVIQALREGAQTWGLSDDLSASLLLRIPDVLIVQSVEQTPEELFQCTEKAMKKALKKLVSMRIAEGRELAEDFSARLTCLEERLEKIKTRASDIPVKIRKKLYSALKAAGLDGVEEDERILREIALLGEKADISEEITRLESHLKQFRSRLRAVKPVGRELDFLLQEFLREINTIGSKANDLMITRQVVSFKTELERIREQVQNVE